MAHPTYKQRHAGFTLMEVLAALAVVAIALTAILSSSGRTVSNVVHMRDGTLAQWVAENRIAELRLEGEWPSTGRSNGEVEMAGREWFWEAEVENTQDEDLRRVDVSVSTSRDAERSAANLSAFIGRPMPTNPPAYIPPAHEPPENGDPDDPGGPDTPPPPPPGGR